MQNVSFHVMTKPFQILLFCLTISLLSFSQTDKRLVSHLINTYPPKKGLKFGQFYFDSTQKPVRYIDSTLDRQLNNYQFYVCDLLSMGCWAPQYYKCIIAYNATKNSSAIFPPLWYSAIDQSFANYLCWQKQMIN